MWRWPWIGALAAGDPAGALDQPDLELGARPAVAQRREAALGERRRRAPRARSMRLVPGRGGVGLVEAQRVRDRAATAGRRRARRAPRAPSARRERRRSSRRPCRSSAELEPQALQVARSGRGRGARGPRPRRRRRSRRPRCATAAAPTSTARSRRATIQGGVQPSESSAALVDQRAADPRVGVEDVHVARARAVGLGGDRAHQGASSTWAWTSSSWPGPQADARSDHQPRVVGERRSIAVHDAAPAMMRPMFSGLKKDSCADQP